MRILHFILGKANPDRANGVNQVIHGLAKYQSKAGHEVRVLGISRSMKVPYEKVQREYFEVECFKTFNSKSFAYLKEIVQNIDVVHLHGVWNKNNIVVGRHLEKIAKPYVITAHCGYSLDRLKQSNYLFKLLYHKLWQKRLYEHAAGIHALTREEATDISRFCKNNNIFVVPNGVDPDTFDKYCYQVHEDRNKIRFGYLGRLSVEKNIDNLIYSISLLPTDIKSKVELLLIGPVNNKDKSLQRLVTELDIKDNVKFVGGQYGENKIQALLDLDFYIHPAYSDVVGIAVMEALALGLPTIVTRTSHMSYFNNMNAFIMVEPTATDFCRGINEMISKRLVWHEYSDRAKKLYKKEFNWNTNAHRIVELYKSLYNNET